MVYGLLALLVVLLDQATKYYVVTHFALGESVPVINNVFHWTFMLIVVPPSACWRATVGLNHY